MTLPDGTYSGETGWAGSGGGTSIYEPEPSLSAGGADTPATAKARTWPSSPIPNRRGGLLFVRSRQPAVPTWTPGGGTSLAAPCWAGLIVIANQIRADQETRLPRRRVADAARSLLAAGRTISTTSPAAATATVPRPAAGYDLVTGLGTPKANLLVPALAASTPTRNDRTSRQLRPIRPTLATINFTVVFSEPVTDFADGRRDAQRHRRRHHRDRDPRRHRRQDLQRGRKRHDRRRNRDRQHRRRQWPTMRPAIANDASTSTDNSVTFDITPPTVTINQATGQTDPTNGSHRSISRWCSASRSPTSPRATSRSPAPPAT